MVNCEYEPNNFHIITKFDETKTCDAQTSVKGRVNGPHLNLDDFKV